MGVLLGFALGLGFSLLFDLKRTTKTQRECQPDIISADDHTSEAVRLLHLALEADDPIYQRALRDEAWSHFVKADCLENGPYKY